MKLKVLFGVVFSLFVVSVCGQSANATFGEVLKIRKGSTDLDVVNVDKSGVYVLENHQELRTYYVFGYSTRTAATLIKLDNSLSEIYTNNFGKELKGKDYQDILFINDKIYLFASALNKKTNILDVYATEIDKSNGEMKGEWTSIYTLEKKDKSANVRFTINYDQDSTGFIIATGTEYSDRVELALSRFDGNLKMVGKPINISNNIDPKLFDVISLTYTPQGYLLMANEVREYEEGKKQKAKFLQVKEYEFKLYDPAGKLVKQLNTGADGSKYVMQSLVRLMPDGNFALGSLYANKRKSREINGVMFIRFNGKTGEIINQGAQEISNAMLTVVPDDSDDDDDDSESRAERKERKRLEKLQANDGGISKTFVLKDFVPMVDGSMMMLAEQQYTYTSTTYDGKTTRTYVHDVYGNLLMVKVSPTSQIDWMHMLPKNQDEVVGSSSSLTSTGIYFWNYIRPATYMSYGKMMQQGTNNLLLFFLDNPKNSKVLNPGQKAKMMNRVSKANCDMLVIDLKTGNYKRSTIFNNSDDTDAMPSMGRVFGKNYYFVAKKKELTPFGKAKVAVGKLTIK